MDFHKNLKSSQATTQMRKKSRNFDILCNATAFFFFKPGEIFVLTATFLENQPNKQTNGKTILFANHLINVLTVIKQADFVSYAYVCSQWKKREHRLWD